MISTMNLESHIFVYGIVTISALCASGLTFFSGFGLGTLLMPIFAIFFPLERAIAMTAIVHFSNNLFKLALAGRFANRSVVGRFGIPAFLAALLGAQMLIFLSRWPPLFRYSIGDRWFFVSAIKLVMAFLMIGFALFETLPQFQSLSVTPRYLPLGGVLSGFFGGLSGHQGALRSVFLLRCGLSKEGFIGTGVVIASLVDLGRIGVYGSHLGAVQDLNQWPLIVAAILAAFCGAVFGSRFIHKITLKSIQAIVSVLLVLIALLLGAGIL